MSTHQSNFVKALPIILITDMARMAGNRPIYRRCRLSVFDVSWYNPVMNETVVRNVGDLDRSDRSALERVVGHSLGESQRLVIQVMTLDVPPAQPAGAITELPDWTDVYRGLDDKEIDELDGVIRERANLTRSSNGKA